MPLAMLHLCAHEPKPSFISGNHRKVGLPTGKTLQGLARSIDAFLTKLCILGKQEMGGERWGKFLSWQGCRQSCVCTSGHLCPVQRTVSGIFNDLDLKSCLRR
jgi:hypothetical protein